ncbi:MAG: hypothetical protein KA035_01730 [Candidatus Levybacteria bacterium]|nr:hypothetical protein [Candidatus Levybacteria bacterium]
MSRHELQFAHTNEAIAFNLRRFGVPLDKWGKGGAKTIDHLAKEIHDGETVLVANPAENRIERHVSTLSIGVHYFDAINGDYYTLREEKQVFSDGRERSRKKHMTGSLGEKLIRGEDVEIAVERALFEELGIHGDVESYDSLSKPIHEERMSNSYPGLFSVYEVYGRWVRLLPHQFNPEGYIEAQRGLTTYFEWEKKTRFPKDPFMLSKNLK